MGNRNGELRPIKVEEVEDFINNPEKYFKDVTIVTSYSYSLIAELMSKIVLPEGIEILDDEAFNWQDIKSYRLPKSLKIIGNGVFSGNQNLRTIRIPDSVQFIGKDCFSNCQKLQSVKLPQNLKIINTCMFWRCEKLQHITIPETVTQIRDGAFDLSGLEEVSLPESLEMIDDNAFKNTNIKEIVFPKSLLNIGERAFALTKLESVEFNDGLEEIGDSAFDRAEYLKQVVLPNSLKKLGHDAFNYCSNLATVELGDGLEELKTFTFENCKKLTKVGLGKNIKKIGEACFYNCENLENIELPEGLEKIGPIAFTESGIKSLYLPKSIKTIGADIFGTTHYTLYIDYFTGKFSLDGCTEKKPNKVQCMFKSNLLHLAREELILVPILMACNNNKKMYEKLCELTDFEKVMCASLYETYGLDRVMTFLVSKEERKIIKSFTKQFTHTTNYVTSEVLEGGLSIFQQELYGMSKLLIALGIFEKDFSQKASSFVANFVTSIVGLEKVGKYGGLELKETFNPTFAKHILNNSHKEELVNTEKINEGVLIYLYNNYETLKSYLKNRKQPTLNLAQVHKKVFSRKLLGLNKKTLPIAMVLSKYYLEEDDNFQNIFDRAVDIFRIKEEKQVPDHILSFDLNEKDIFSRTEEKLSTAEVEAKITINILKTLAEAMNVMKKDNPYYFQYLNKGLVDNLALGIDVDCCAHLENVGEGIAVQSVINPNTQNLVITDKKGNRVAKAVFTICPEEGYGLYNNVEIKNSIYKNSSGDLISVEQKSKIERFIFDKVMLATASFVECYNREHPEKPIKKFYMGVSDGDLNELFISAFRDKTSKKDLTRRLDKVHYPNENGISVYHEPLEKVVCYNCER